jgi:LPS O-antigen subunit length determinant protein (WzzB/FepE family)
MTTKTQRLETAKRIMACSDDSHICDPLGCEECEKQEKEALAILSTYSAQVVREALDEYLSKIFKVFREKRREVEVKKEALDLEKKQKGRHGAMINTSHLAARIEALYDAEAYIRRVRYLNDKWSVEDDESDCFVERHLCENEKEG